MRKVHDGLLKVAEELLGPTVARQEGSSRARRARPGPRSEAQLRRAVSTAYYALFHLLVYESTRATFSAGTRRLLGPTLRRTYQHRVMVSVSKLFAGRGTRSDLVDRLLGPRQVSADLQAVADAFVNLHEWREDADYVVDKPLDQRLAERAVSRARDAFAAWKRVRRDDDALAYLAALFSAARVRGD